MFNKQKNSNKYIAHVCARVNHTSNTNKIVYVTARVNHDPVPITKTDRRPRMNHNPKKQRFRTFQQGIECQPRCEYRLHSHQFPNEIFIYKLFNKKYWNATIIHYSTI